jgi:putative transposase
MMDLVEELDSPSIPITQACIALGISRATMYRRTTPPMPPSYSVRPPNPRRLGENERQEILDVLHSEQFVDQPPPEVYAALLSQGVYMASIRTMYRLLAERGESRERRAQRAPMKHVKPTLTATAPNEVWTWDITKLRSIVPGVIFSLYVIIDLFSRMVVGWLLAECENASHAERLFADTIARHGIAPGALTVHADRGSPMRSDDLAQLLATLGVARSFSRPHVSDDNAFSEAQFKTLKYQPDYPGQFASLTHARAWCQEFIGWFNEQHQHSGIALYTPADVFYGRVEEVAARRQTALDEAFAAHPERFPNGPPVAKRPPEAVHINPLPVEADASNVIAAGAEKKMAPRAAAKTPQHEPPNPGTENLAPTDATTTDVMAARAEEKITRHAAAKTPRHDAPNLETENVVPTKKENASHAAARTPRRETRGAAVSTMPS